MMITPLRLKPVCAQSTGAFASRARQAESKTTTTRVIATRGEMVVALRLKPVCAQSTGTFASQHQAESRTTTTRVVATRGEM
ncbi:MAG: hypothetical protein H0U76_01040 [Ktedonobacteraceae bacterium]|nr:hypothetical protein [Ktedonobacteraceae bacterium]